MRDVLERFRITLDSGSHWKKALVLIIITFFVLFSSGIIFGWPALQLVFLREGLFEDACGNTTIPTLELRNATLVNKFLWLK